MSNQVTAPSGSVGSARPDVDWTIDAAIALIDATGTLLLETDISAVIDGVRLYVLPYSAFVTTYGEARPASVFFAAGVTGAAVHVTPSASWTPVSVPGTGDITPTADLPFGELKPVVVFRASALGAYYWLVGPSFFRTDTPATPSSPTPAAASTVDTNLPTLGLTLAASGGLTPVRAEWQLATDSGFTANVRTVTEPVADQRVSGITSEVVPSASKLFAGTWHLRGRAKNAGGETSAWTTGHSFTVAHLPSTVAHSPRGGQVLDYGDGFITFGWQFSSSSPDLAQSAYRVIVETVDDSTEVLDTTKVTDTDEVVVLEVDDDYLDEQLRWKVKVWDTEDVEGDFSDWQLFQLVEVGEVAITSPTEDEEIAAALTVEWTHTPSGSGAIQAAYRVVIREATVDEAVVYDSGLVYSTVESLEIDPGVLENDSGYTVEVIVRDTLDLEGSAVQPFTVAWDPPAALAFTVEASTFDTAGPVTVLIDASGGLDEDFAFLRVQRRALGGDWALVGDFTAVADYIRVGDYEARPTVTQEYEVRQYAYRFDTLVASPAPEPVEVTPPKATSFWLITDENRAVAGDSAPAVASLAAVSSLRIELASDDPHVDEFERVEVALQGRGRKVEMGTRWGRRGTLSFTLLDAGTTAYEQQATLEGFLESTPTLRKPNSEVFPVSFTVQFTPQGRDDVVGVQLAYAEVV